MHNFDPYVTRPTKFIDQVNSEGWRIKIYGISAKSLPLPKDVVSEGIKNLLPHLPQPAITEQRYGVGFLIIHHGTMRNWYLLDWWEKEDIIHHKLFSSPLDKPREALIYSLTGYNTDRHLKLHGEPCNAPANARR